MSDEDLCTDVWLGHRCLRPVSHTGIHQYDLADGEVSRCSKMDFNPNTMAQQQCRQRDGHFGPHTYG